jgi:pyrophosphatase PpaX
MTRTPPRTILFDLDGTLIDTIDLILRSYRYTVSVHHFEPVPDEAWLKNIGIPLRMQFRHFTEDPDEIQAMIKTYVAHNLEHHDDLVGQYPGVLEGVRALHSAGCKLGIVTSKRHGSLERGLTIGGFDGLFDVVIGADDVQNPKPHPEPVLKALEGLDVSPDEAVFVGDSPFDMACGRAAGVETAAAMWGPFSREDLEPNEPNYWLDTPQALERFV